MHNTSMKEEYISRYFPTCLAYSDIFPQPASHSEYFPSLLIQIFILAPHSDIFPQPLVQIFSVCTNQLGTALI
jgi:hypothetical protein